jgi:alpha/beta superfamily hydrolase
VGEIEDVLAVLQHIRQTQAPLPILLAGFSFGAYVAAHVQTRTEIDQLLLLGLAAGKYPIATPHVPTQTLVIHGEADEVIPLADVMDWARPQGLPVMVFPETSHFFHGRLIQLGQAIQSRLPPLP